LQQGEEVPQPVISYTFDGGYNEGKYGRTLNAAEYTPDGVFGKALKLIDGSQLILGPFSQFLPVKFSNSFTISGWFLVPNDVSSVAGNYLIRDAPPAGPMLDGVVHRFFVKVFPGGVLHATLDRLEVELSTKPVKVRCFRRLFVWRD
jgi:hypothetical protein